MDLQIRRMEKEDIESCTELFIQAFAREPWKENHEALAVCIGMSKPWMKGIEYYLDLLCVDWRWQGKGSEACFWKKCSRSWKKMESMESFSAQRGPILPMSFTKRTVFRK